MASLDCETWDPQILPLSRSVALSWDQHFPLHEAAQFHLSKYNDHFLLDSKNFTSIVIWVQMVEELRMLLNIWWGRERLSGMEILAWHALFCLIYESVSFWVSTDYHGHNYSNLPTSANIANNFALRSDYLRTTLSCCISITAFV